MTSLTLVLASLLEASPAGGAPGGPPGGCIGNNPMLLMMVMVFAIFWLLIIRPQNKREKERQAMLASLKPGDTVVTVGGLVGKVTGTSDRYVVLEISPKVRVRVLRANVAGKEEEATESSKRSTQSGRKKKNKKKSGDKGKTSDSATSEEDEGVDDE